MIDRTSFASFAFVLALLAPFSFAVQCSVSAFPVSVEAGSTSLISLVFEGKESSSTSFIINCGNGHSVAAFGCAGTNGYCTATCYYPYTGVYEVSSQVDYSYCSSSYVSVTKATPACGDGACSSFAGESPKTCPVDCGQLYYCGDGICSSGESPSSCATDCGNAVSWCSDGTRNSTCSYSQPYYCSSGVLTRNASICGCPSGFVPSGDECVEPSCADGTKKNSCSLSRPLYCNASLSLVEKSSLCGCPAGLSALSDSCATAGSCNTFNAYALDSSRTVAGGSEARYRIMVSNPSTVAQSVSVSSQLPYSLTGGFSNGSYFNLAAGAYATAELFVRTGSSKPDNYSIPISVSALNCRKDFSVNLTVNSSVPSSCCSGSDLVASLDKAEPVLVSGGDEVEYVLYLYNNASSRIIVGLSASSSQLPASFSRTGFALEAGQSDAVSVRFTVPAGTPGNQFSLPIMVRYTTTCCVREFPVTASISVAGPRTALSLIGEPAPSCMAIQKDGGEKRVELGLRNDGDSAQAYALSIDERYPLRGNARLTQNSITLQSGETGYFSILLSPSSLNTGYTYTYTLSARTGAFTVLSRNYCFFLSSGSSTPTPTPVRDALSVDASEMAVVSGVAKTFLVRVSNPSAATFENLSVRLEGAPSSWYSPRFVEPYASLLPYSARTFTINVTVPANEKESYRQVQVAVLSGGYIAGRANSSVEVAPQSRKLEYAYSVKPTITDGEQISTLEVVMNVVNKGNVDEKGITPEISQTAKLNYSFEPARLDLAPGQSGVFRITFWPSEGTSPNQNVPVRVSSSAGSSVSSDISLPAMTGFALLGRSMPAWVTGLAAAILAVIAMVLLASYREPRRMG